MPPKKTKAQEALAFLDDLDSFEPEHSAQQPVKATGTTPRPSTDSTRPAPSPVASAKAGAIPDEDPEAASALAFLEAQLAQKRAPLSKPATPAFIAPAATASASVETPAIQSDAAPTSTSSSAAGWGSSWWSSASAALQQAQKVADERYKQVKDQGVSAGVAGLDLDGLRRGAGERLHGISDIVKGVDLEKLRAGLVSTTTSALTDLINTVAPPISEHETLELWLTHPLVGYAGVEGVVYRAWTRILEQTESGELVVVWSPSPASESDTNVERSINPVEGWETAWKTAQEEIERVKNREQDNPKGRAKTNADLPVTTVPIFLHLMPILAPLPFSEPPVILDKEETADAKQPAHLSFLLTLQDPSHRLRFSTVSQAVPADWLEVEYDRSDWVEERLVDVLRVAVEVVAQEYVATRMALKRPVATSGTQTPAPPETEAAPVPAPANA